MTKRMGAETVARIISDSGGRIVGRTKLQKVSYLLEAAGLGEGFEFEYRHYGPYSEELTSTAKRASILGLIDESEHSASWGGLYTIYETPDRRRFSSSLETRHRLAEEAASADSLLLELAATALFLAREGMTNPWEETARRKPDKVHGTRLDDAKQLYERLRKIPTPVPLPRMPS